MSKKSRFRKCFDKQYGKCAQALLKSVTQHLYHIHRSIARKLSSKTSLLFTCQNFGPLVNTLAAYKKYPALNRENLKIPIQMHISEKSKKFSEFFAAFLKPKLNFENFEKKTTFTAFVFPKSWTAKRQFEKCLKSPVLEDPFEKQHGKRAQALLKYVSQ